MIHAVFECTPHGELTGYSAVGHSGYAEEGHDIVCAGASILATTCVNSLEILCGISTGETVTVWEPGHLAFHLPGTLDPDSPAMQNAQLLLQSMRLGVKDLAKEYPKYIRVSEKRTAGT